MDKRIKILLIAKKRFSQYGYNNVSMQSIAEDGNISKASIYKLFVSKNELLRELIKYNVEQLIYQASIIDLEKNLSDEEKFKAKILYEIESYKENKELSKMIMFTSTSTECKDIKEHIKFVQCKLVNLNKNILLQYYGKDIQNAVLDLTFIFFGTISLFTQLMLDGTSTITDSQIVEEIKKILDVLVKDKKNRPPLLTEKNMNIRFNYSDDKGISKEELIEKCLSDMANILKGLSDQDNQKKELLFALKHLHEEISKETKANYLIDALLGYLDQLDELKPIVIKLKTLL